METYRQLAVHISPKSAKTQFYLFIASGVLSMVIGVMNYLKNSEDIWLPVIWFIGGIGYIVGATVQKNNNGKFFVEFNDVGIDAKLSVFKTINIKWSEIKVIEIKPLNIIFKLEDDLKEELSLSVWSYGSVLNIKAKLKEFALEKDIKLI